MVSVATGKSKVIKTSKMPSIDKGISSVGSWGTQHAGKQVPGQSASGGNSSGKFAEGGKNPMFPKGSSKPQMPR